MIRTRSYHNRKLMGGKGALKKDKAIESKIQTRLEFEYINQFPKINKSTTNAKRAN